MTARLGDPGPGRRWLLVAAAPKEVKAVMAGLSAAGPPPAPWTIARAGERFDLLATGVGKANAAGALARTLDPAVHAGVVNVGLAGALPGGGLGLGDAIAASASVYADEGLASPDGFRDVGAMGFAPASDLDPGLGVGCPGDRGLLDRLDVVVTTRGVVATVSTCSGADALAAEVARRTGGAAEAMEGAALAFAARRIGPTPFAEIRVVSNTTGDRARQRWDLSGGLARLAEAASRL